MSKLNRASHIIILVFIVGFFLLLIKEGAKELDSNPNANLSEDSQEYVNDLLNRETNLDESRFDDRVEDPLQNTSKDNKYDFSLEFNFIKKKVEGFKNFFYMILNIPETVLVDILKLPLNDYKVYVNIIDWLFNIMVSMAIIAYIRGRD